MHRPGLSPLRQLVAGGATGRSRWLPVAAALLVLAAYLALSARSPVPPASGLAPAAPTAVASATPGEYRLAPYQPEATSGLGLPEPDWPALLLDVGVKLALTLGLAYVTIYLLRRYVARPVGQRRIARIVIVETVPLGQHRSLHLVKVGDRHILIGATPQQISLLTEVNDSTGEPAATSLAPASLPAEESFGERLRALTGASERGD